MKSRKKVSAFVVAVLAASLEVSTTFAAKDAKTAGGEVMTIGEGKFKSPETVIHDEKADVYLVSNVNGKLTARDDNGFISRVSPDGKIIDLKWIDGASGPDTFLHAPKDMLLTDKHLIVADAGAVRYFERGSGEPVRSVIVDDSHMLNGLAMEPGNEVIYVTDTGGKTDDRPGAVYRIDGHKAPEKIAKGPQLDRPNGVAWQGQGLLVAPFGQHAKTLYHLSLAGEKESRATLPHAQLDGLLMLPDDSIVVTSWKGKTIYRVRGDTVEVVAGGVRTPAQIGYDGKRERLLVPAAKENKILVYKLESSK